MTGTLSTTNICREPRRSANTASALMMGLLLLSLTATISGSARVLMEERVAGNVLADLYVSSTQFNLASGPVVGFASYEIIRDTPGVEAAMRSGSGTVLLDGEKLSVGVSDSAVADELYAFDTNPPMSRLGGGAYVGPRLQELGYEPGDVLTLDGPRGDVSVTITGRSNDSMSGDLLVDWATGEKLFGQVETVSVLLSVEPGYDTAEVKANLDQALSDFPLITVFEKSDLTSMVDQIVTMVLALISALLSGALVIAVLGIANALLLSVTERTREIGLLRAVGLSRRAVRRMIRLESVAISAFGAAMGIALGTALGAAMMVALKDLGLATLNIPWLLLGLYFLIAVLVGHGAAALPARRAARLDILEAVTTE